ncbi:hypothetical protein AX16_008223 [Volvariella volvacea WC 439]|nr:hypothetical protein AX16_008223 [Volvariella volvacea WC 439]
MRLRRRAIGVDMRLSEESEPEIAVEPNATRDSSAESDVDDDAEVNDELEADSDEDSGQNDGEGEGDGDEDVEEDVEWDGVEVDVEGDEEVDEMQESDDEDADEEEEEEEEEVRPKAGGVRSTTLRNAGGRYGAGRGGGRGKAAASTGQQQHLKIKLKLPAPSTANTSAAATPEPIPPPRGKRGGRSQARVLNIESEDADEGEEDEDTNNTYSRATSIAAPSTRPMTTRQAVLASVVDSSHVSLDEGIKRKKVLNETELALRREETARKRKNLSEKKLENEKAETINRLLKKQSRTKGKRGPAAAAAAAASTADTPNLAGSRTPAEDEDGAGGGAELGAIEQAMEGVDVEKAVPPLPVMYRWVSRVEDGGEGKKGRVCISFSAPVCALPGWMRPVEEVEEGQGQGGVDKDGDVKMESTAANAGGSALPSAHGTGGPLVPPPLPLPSKEKPRCAVPNCGAERKYRLVKDFNVGACGIVHLKLLEGMSAGASGVAMT